MNRFRFTIAEVEEEKNICKRCGSVLIPKNREQILEDTTDNTWHYSTTSSTNYSMMNSVIEILPCWYCETCDHFFGRRIKYDED